MTIFEIILIVVASPFLTYFLVKFGRYGYLKANKLFANQENKHK